MTIEGLNGKTYDVTGSGTGGTALGLGIAGTALGLLNGGSGLFGGILGGTRAAQGTCSEDHYVTRYDAELMHQNAEKDVEISILKSAQDTDKKLVDVYATLKSSENQLRDRIDIVGKELSDKIIMERESRLVSEKDQAVFNQSMIGSTATINAQIASMNNILNSISTNVVPANKVCQTGCCCANN